MKITVTSKEKAWGKVNEIFPTDYEKDYAASNHAGYDIYRHRELNHYSRICDLGNRLEVLTGEYGENVTNIWIEEPKQSGKEMKLKIKMLISREIDEIRTLQSRLENIIHKEYEKVIPMPSDALSLRDIEIGIRRFRAASRFDMGIKSDIEYWIDEFRSLQAEVRTLTSLNLECEVA